MAAPVSDQLARRLAHRHRHLDGALCRVGAGHRIVKEHHDPVTGEMVERALELGDERPQRAMVFAHENEDFLGFRGFSEGGVATQIAEHDDDFAAMAFEDLFIALRDNHLGKLGR